MGRYYDIALSSNPAISLPNSNLTTGWSSYPNGVNDPGALQIELDCVFTPQAAPGGNCTITIHGIALSDLQQAQQYTGMFVTVRGGMQAGLPLANASQAGMIVAGEIQQAYGNWVGTDMNLNFVIVPAAYTYDNPGNIVFQWKPGQSLASALTNTLAIAYPGISFDPQIAGTYSTSAPLVHAVATLTQLAQFVKSQTASATSDGVDISVQQDGSLLAFDGLVKQIPVDVAFIDLVGQPKWVKADIMQFTTVMRADIQVGSLVKMPVGLSNRPGLIGTIGEGSQAFLKYRTSFQGPFIVNAVRHVGNFRDPDGSSWVSIFQAAAPPSQAINVG